MKIGPAKHTCPMAKGTRVRKSVATYGIVLVAVLGTICGHELVAHALDPIPAGVVSGLQAGVVTSLGHQSLFISGKEYTLDPEIVIRDQEGNELQSDVIKIGHEVKFHLKKGDGNKIDVMIVYMPQ